MIIVNFSHPLTDEQLQQIRSLVGDQSDELREIHEEPDFQDDRPFVDQADAFLSGPTFAKFDWERREYIIVLPGNSAIAAILLAALHGRSGHFPSVVRRQKRPIAGWDVAELIELDTVRRRIGRQKRPQNIAPSSPSA